MKCKVWSVKCEVWSVKCEVWSVKWKVWSVKCKRQAPTPLKTDGWGMWLRESLPVAWERPAGGFETFEGGQTAGSNALKKQMAGAYTDGWGVAARVVVESCLGKAGGRV